MLFLSVLWKGCATKGAVIGGFLGLVSSVVLTVVSPSCGGGPSAIRGLGLVPVPFACPVLDDHRLPRHLDILGARPQLAGGEGEVDSMRSRCRRRRGWGGGGVGALMPVRLAGQRRAAGFSSGCRQGTGRCWIIDKGKSAGQR